MYFKHRIQKMNAYVANLTHEIGDVPVIKLNLNDWS